MPSLIRFLSAIGVLAVLAVASMVVLATRPAPSPREMTVTIPPGRLAKANESAGTGRRSRRLAPLENQKPGRLAGVLETLPFDR